MTTNNSYLHDIERQLAGHPNRDRWIQAVLGEKDVGFHLAKRFRSLGIKPGGRVLEVGCGEGGITITLQREGFQATGLEIEDERVRVAFRRAEEEGGKPLFIRGSAYELPVPTNSQDAVVLENVIEHLEFWPQAAVEIGRILCPGGFVAISLPNRFGLRTIIADPHWQIFGLVLLPRPIAKWLIEKVLQRSNQYDVFDMPSLRRLSDIFAAQGIELQLCDGYDRLVVKQQSQEVNSRTWLKRKVVWQIGKSTLLRSIYRFYRRYISETWILEGVKRG